MFNAMTSDQPEMYSGLQLQEDEHVVYSGYARQHWLRNPLQPSRKQPDGFVLTNRRLIMFSQPRAAKPFGARVALLTTMPLEEIDSVQVLDVRWGLMSLLAFLVLCLLYLIPGIIFLCYMGSYTGLWFAATAGNCNNELNFAREDSRMLGDMIDAIHKFKYSNQSGETLP